jgi:hypothetical protein
METRQRELLSRFRGFCEGKLDDADPENINYKRVKDMLQKRPDEVTQSEREYIFKCVTSHPGYEAFRELSEKMRTKFDGQYDRLHGANDKVNDAMEKRSGLAAPVIDDGALKGISPVQPAEEKKARQRYQKIDDKFNRGINKMMAAEMGTPDWEPAFFEAYPFAYLGFIRNSRDHRKLDLADSLGIPEERAKEICPNYMTENKGFFGGLVGLFKKS